MTTDQKPNNANLIPLEDAATALDEQVLLRRKAVLVAQLRMLYMNVDQAVNLVENGILDTTDAGYHTFLRLLQVFGNVMANNTSDDSYNPNSVYEQLLQADPAMPGILAGAGLVSAILGSALILAEMRNERERNTTTYQLAKVTEANPDTLLNSDEELAAQYQLFLQKRKVSTKATVLSDLTINNMPKPSKMAAFFQRLEKNTLFRMLTNALDKAKTASLFYWPVWMVGAIVTGLVAVGTFPVAPIVLAISIVLASAYMGIVSYIRYRKNKAPNASIVQTSNIEGKELVRAREELKQHLNIKESHRYFNLIFRGKVITRNIGKNAPVIDPAYSVRSTGDDKVIYLEPKDSIDDKTSKVSLTTESEYTTAKQDIVLNSRIYKHLTDAKRQKRQRGVSTAFDIIGKYTLTAFIFWLAYAIFAAVAMTFALPILLPFVAVIGSYYTSTIVGAIAGGFSGMREFFKMKKNDAESNAQVEARLAAPYLGKISGTREHGMSKAEAFTHFEDTMNERKAKIKDALLAKQAELKAKKASKQPLDAKEIYLLSLDLKKIDVYNEHYFKMQTTRVSLGTRIKQISSDVYKMMSSGQTGIFIVRTLLLVSGVVALCVAAPPLAFILVAVAAATAMIALRAVHIHLTRKSQQAAYMATTIDSRIYYMEKQCKELAVLDKVLNGDTETPDAAPAVGAASDPVPAPQPKAATTFDATTTTLIDLPVDAAILDKLSKPLPTSKFNSSTLFHHDKCTANIVAELSENMPTNHNHPIKAA